MAPLARLVVWALYQWPDISCAVQLDWQESRNYFIPFFSSLIVLPTYLLTPYLSSRSLSHPYLHILPAHTPPSSVLYPTYTLYSYNYTYPTTSPSSLIPPTYMYTFPPSLIPLPTCIPLPLLSHTPTYMYTSPPPLSYPYLHVYLSPSSLIPLPTCIPLPLLSHTPTYIPLPLLSYPYLHTLPPHTSSSLIPLLYLQYTLPPLSLSSLHTSSLHPSILYRLSSHTPTYLTTPYLPPPSSTGYSLSYPYLPYHPIPPPSLFLQVTLSHTPTYIPYHHIPPSLSLQVTLPFLPHTTRTG